MLLHGAILPTLASVFAQPQISDLMDSFTAYKYLTMAPGYLNPLSQRSLALSIRVPRVPVLVLVYLFAKRWWNKWAGKLPWLKASKGHPLKSHCHQHDGFGQPRALMTTL